MFLLYLFYDNRHLTSINSFILKEIGNRAVSTVEAARPEWVRVDRSAVEGGVRDSLIQGQLVIVRLQSKSRLFDVAASARTIRRGYQLLK